LAGRTTGSFTAFVVAVSVVFVSGFFMEEVAVARTFGNGISPVKGLKIAEFELLLSGVLGLLVPDGSELEHPVTRMKPRYNRSLIIRVFMALPLWFYKMKSG
jgi:hypothetical protein